ncbi:MAG: hypothetical protein AAFY56_13855 [Pseudomonadota bacterium]
MRKVGHVPLPRAAQRWIEQHVAAFEIDGPSHLSKEQVMLALARVSMEHPLRFALFGLYQKKLNQHTLRVATGSLLPN